VREIREWEASRFVARLITVARLYLKKKESGFWKGNNFPPEVVRRLTRGLDESYMFEFATESTAFSMLEEEIREGERLGAKIYLVIPEQICFDIVFRRTAMSIDCIEIRVDGVESLLRVLEYEFTKRMGDY